MGFKKITGAEGNSVVVGDETTFGDDCWIEFKTFFNGSGGKENKVIIGARCRMRVLKLIVQGTGNTVVIGDDALFTGSITILGSGRTVAIGKNCTANGVIINCRDQDVHIGVDCLFSSEIKIRTSDAHKIFDAATKKQINAPAKPVIIGNHVWVGQDVFIGKNASIPDGCVVGTRATITKQITQENCIIAGLGKVIREGIYWEK